MTLLLDVTIPFHGGVRLLLVEVSEGARDGLDSESESDSETRNFQVVVRISSGSLQATLSKLLTYCTCAQANSAFYPQRDGK